MSEANARELLEMTLAQEEKYQFTRLSHKDLLRLGGIMAKNADSAYKPVSVEIMVNGLVIFAYYPDGATMYYKQVMNRKHKTANDLEKCSLRFFAENELNGVNPAEAMRLSPDEYQFRGGSFPIRIKGGLVVGSLAAAGMAHTEDHDLIVRSLEEYFSRQ